MSLIGVKRPKSSAIKNIAHIERHNICPGGRLFRIWDENSPCYCTGIIDAMKIAAALGAKMSENSRMTLEEISKEIHISRTTIYKVLNNTGKVRSQTKERVLRAMEEYHYTPNNNARNLAKNQKYQIALIDYDSPNAPYFRPAIDVGIQRTLDEYGDNGLVVYPYTAQADAPDTQIQYFHEAFGMGIRNFVIAAADPQKITPVLAHLKESECSVVLLSKQVPGAAYDALIGIDDYQAGTMAGSLLGKMVSENGSIQVILGQESYSSTASMQQRLQGFSDVIRTVAPKVHILPVMKGLNSEQNIFQSLQIGFENNKIDGIYDLTYHPDFVAKYIKARGSSKVRLICMDLFREIEPYIQDGTIDAVIYQNLSEQAYLACTMLFEKMCYQKKIPSGNHYEKLEVIIRENLKYFL